MIAYPLRPESELEAFTSDVRRVVGALMDEAITLLSDPDRLGVEKTVHETRKRLKETRSLLRLLRQSLVNEEGKRIRSAENQALRAAAAELGQARDAAVMIQTLDTLPKDANLAPLRQRLRQRYEAMQQESRGGMAAALETLRDARTRVNSWCISARTPWKAIAPNLKRIYGRGHAEFITAAENDDPHLWHEWRKRVKDLRYALELLRDAAPELLGSMREVAKTLSDDIGLDHDLAVLLETVSREELADRDTLASLETMIMRRRAELQATARPLGQRLYAETPAAFVRRIKRYWSTAADAD